MPRAKKEDKKEEKKATSQTADKADADLGGIPTEWATGVVNQLVEAQKMWLELVTKQNQVVFNIV